MRSSFSERWLRGFGLTILAGILLGIAWGIPQGIGQLIVESDILPEWLRTVLLGVWVVLMLLFCPVIFEWLVRKVGFVPRDTRVTVPGRDPAEEARSGLTNRPLQPTGAAGGPKVSGTHPGGK